MEHVKFVAIDRSIAGSKWNILCQLDDIRETTGLLRELNELIACYAQAHTPQLVLIAQDSKACPIGLRFYPPCRELVVSERIGLLPAMLRLKRRSGQAWMQLIHEDQYHERKWSWDNFRRCHGAIHLMAAPCAVTLFIDTESDQLVPMFVDRWKPKELQHGSRMETIDSIANHYLVVLTDGDVTVE